MSDMDDPEELETGDEFILDSRMMSDVQIRSLLDHIEQSTPAGGPHGTEEDRTGILEAIHDARTFMMKLRVVDHSKIDRVVQMALHLRVIDRHGQPLSHTLH